LFDGTLTIYSRVYTVVTFLLDMQKSKVWMSQEASAPGEEEEE
jgi:hypothetical protein